MTIIFCLERSYRTHYDSVFQTGRRGLFLGEAQMLTANLPAGLFLGKARMLSTILKGGVETQSLKTAALRCAN